mmetsp:Transcript_14062/g.21222  ORF Transcript_14062/g.21222 Transcript_14062/m.21222 type:complete len:304 (+) Transcript_14062:50-961(+)|eukprot:CAMPEP_0197318694 /NCGR_PEP_ID=MMETSP0891-20130614/52109_1 /TAXON_ID=44058 ORGANISM="Aureoumbra lagunensis, Strain CCMP1510" /NCGR_SAMPLE_ID=MMETSP0891 /ASSEMBLY_ACC=CAM_ASM_000534 /LENGTH=303 /DNA_ID=CAMNT_0042809287 /DNA_START=35 /DNA_END=946 /DNA_ORIENTATION=+
MSNVLRVILLTTLWEAFGMAPPSSGKSSTKSKKIAQRSTSAAIGFGKKNVSSPKQPKISAALLLERSENRYIELEKKYNDHENIIWREFIIAARSDEVTQLSDWVPYCCAGVATNLDANEAMPFFIRDCRRELLESLREILGGSARKQILSASLQWSYEPLDDWNTRVFETLQTSSSHRINEIQNAAKLLGVDHQAELSEIKAAFRSHAKRAHPDSSVHSYDETIPSLSELKSAHDLLADQSASSDYSYDSLGGSGKNKFSSFSGPLALHNNASSPPLDFEAAISRLDPDLIKPFLFRNNRRS